MSVSGKGLINLLSVLSSRPNCLVVTVLLSYLVLIQLSQVDHKVKWRTYSQLMTLIYRLISQLAMKVPPLLLKARHLSDSADYTGVSRLEVSEQALDRIPL